MTDAGRQLRSGRCRAHPGILAEGAGRAGRGIAFSYTLRRARRRCGRVQSQEGGIHGYALRGSFAGCSRSLASDARCRRAPQSAAQDRMDKPVRILVGFAPGGTADLIARVVADKLKDTIGQPVVVENRPGAAGRIAADAVKAAAPDGSTIMVMPIGPMAVVPHTLKTDSVRSGEGLHGDRPRRDVPVRAGRGTRQRRKDVGRVRRVGEGEPGESVVRDVGGRQPARTSSACCCRATSASTWCTSRTKAPPRTSTT